MTSSTRLAVCLGLQLAAGAAFIGCGSDGDGAAEGTGTKGGETAKPGTGSGTLNLTFSPMYSAFVEGHEAQVPVMLKDPSLRTKGAKFTSSDPTIASVVDTAEGGTITVKKDGMVTITGTLGDESGNAKLTIKKYTEAQWMTGQARFSKSDSAIVPANGGPVNALALLSPNARNANGACNTCHTAQAKTLKIENTPTQIAGYSDEDLITIFTKGMKPESAVVKTAIPPFIWGMFHTWTVTEEEKEGLIAYLRTQAPKANPPMIDYGVMPCAGSQPSASGMPMFCTSDGKPVMLPGRGGDAGTGTTPTTPTDAGVPATTTDAGATTTTDAGATTTTTGDAG